MKTAISTSSPEFDALVRSLQSKFEEVSAEISRDIAVITYSKLRR